jgi:hypothetical protein
MARDNLSSAAKARAGSKLSGARKKAAQNVASKIARTSSGKATPDAISKPASVAATAANTSISTNGSIAVVVPGLPTHITPDAISGMLPQFDESAYQISDPLNPPQTLPQATEAQFDKGMGIYEGTQRALKLTGAAFDTTRERFTTLGKQAKAFGAGVKAATEFERVRGDFLDYQGQLQTNDQKGITLEVSQHKTTTDRSKSVHDKAGLDERLEQARIAADLARATTKDKQSKLDEFKKSLGEYAA